MQDPIAYNAIRIIPYELYFILSDLMVINDYIFH